MPLELTKEQRDEMEDVILAAWNAKDCICTLPCCSVVVDAAFAYVRNLVLKEAAQAVEAAGKRYDDVCPIEELAGAVRSLLGQPCR